MSMPTTQPNWQSAVTPVRKCSNGPAWANQATSCRVFCTRLLHRSSQGCPLIIPCARQSGPLEAKLVWVIAGRAAANPAPGPAWASSELKLNSQLHFGIRSMPTFPHPLKGRSVLLPGIVMKLDRCVLCTVSTAPCVIGRWQAWTALCVAPNGGDRRYMGSTWCF
ncbi:hypothetical protein HaLaN_13396 [Haematococcus lacustris]|uniref:Uncharacterized protein n=1 Tax=Haematococcus lacustris TaxID=44745 RepID=A0A699ZC75_HAELA|nr:hypothetical protein HaLaN_13396 [Haematococcus lacustris]